MNVRVIRRLGALTVVAMSLIACGSSGHDESPTVASTTESPATTAAPVPSTEAAVATTVAPAPTTAAPAPTTVAPAPTTVAPTPTTEAAGGDTATCDVASVAEGIGGDVTAVFDLKCVDGWAAAMYTDNKGLSRPAILKAKGRLWILQDWNAVCEGDPMVPGDIAVPESLRVYCPGG